MSAVIDDELVLMNADRAEYYGFDAVARVIWDHLATPIQIGTLSERLGHEFDGDPVQINRDVLEFLAVLAAHGLLRTASAPESA